MIIVNKTTPPRPLVLSRPLPETRTGIIQHEPLILRPGTNEIPDEVQEALEKSSTVKEWIKRSWLQVIKTAKGKEKASGVGSFDDEQAVVLINDCFDPLMLTKWKEGEKREVVRVAIVERVAQLKAVGKEE